MGGGGGGGAGRSLHWGRCSMLYLIVSTICPEVVTSGKVTFSVALTRPQIGDWTAIFT